MPFLSGTASQEHCQYATSAVFEGHFLKPTVVKICAASHCNNFGYLRLPNDIMYRTRVVVHMARRNAQLLYMKGKKDAQ